MQYLLDANVVIDADRDYYPFDRVKEFWGWLLHQANRGKLLFLFKCTTKLLQETVYWSIG